MFVVLNQNVFVENHNLWRFDCTQWVWWGHVSVTVRVLLPPLLLLLCWTPHKVWNVIHFNTSIALTRFCLLKYSVVELDYYYECSAISQWRVSTSISYLSRYVALSIKWTSCLFTTYSEHCVYSAYVGLTIKWTSCLFTTDSELRKALCLQCIRWPVYLMNVMPLRGIEWAEKSLVRCLQCL